VGLFTPQFRNSIAVQPLISFFFLFYGLSGGANVTPLSFTGLWRSAWLSIWLSVPELCLRKLKPVKNEKYIWNGN